MGMIHVTRVCAPRGTWDCAKNVTVDRVVLDRQDAIRPYGKVCSEAGRVLFLALPRGQELLDGDLLYQDGDTAIVVQVRQPTVVEIRLPVHLAEPDVLPYAMRLCHALGNQHLPVRVVPPGIVRVPVDDPEQVLAFLRRSPFADVEAAVVAGVAEDPLPNVHAHV